MSARQCWVACAAVVGGLVLAAGPARAATDPPPSAPGRVAATTRAGTLTVTWQAPSGGPVTGYRVSCSSTDGGPARSASPGAAARSVALPLPDNRTYSCAVAATGPGGTSRTSRTPYVMHAVVATVGGSVRMHVPMAVGQGVTAAAARGTLGADCSSATLTTYAPGGRDLNAACLVSGAAFVDGRNATTRGTGAVALEARDGRKGSAELTAWVYTDVRRPVSVGGAAVTVRTRTPGQNAELSFSVSAPRRVTVDLTGIAVPGGVIVSVLDPSGVTIALGGTSGSTGHLDDVDLSRAGTYRVLVDPRVRATGSVSVRVHA